MIECDDISICEKCSNIHEGNDHYSCMFDVIYFICEKCGYLNEVSYIGDDKNLINFNKKYLTRL